jgi:hypothetical protein
MGIYISIHPTDGAMTQDEVARALQRAGLEISRAFNAEGREIEFGTEPAHRVYLDAGDVEVERNGEFCHAWWRESSGMGASYYESVLDSRLHLAERLGWHVTGGDGEEVTRENFADHVLRLTGEASKLRQMFGAMTSFQSDGLVDEDGIGSPDDGDEHDINMSLEKIFGLSDDTRSVDSDNGKADPSETDGGRDAD